MERGLFADVGVGLAIVNFDINYCPTFLSHKLDLFLDVSAKAEKLLLLELRLVRFNAPRTSTDENADYNAVE